MCYPKVAIIILNWNGWRDTIECLESLYQITYPNYDVILVDNGSKNDSIEKIKDYCAGKIKVESKFFEYTLANKPIKIIEYTREEAECGGSKEEKIADLPSNSKLIIIKNEKNYGFAEGNNIGMRYALRALNPEYILLLNNDIVVDKEFLTQLVKAGESDERIGIVGGKIYHYNSPDVIDFLGADLSLRELKGARYGRGEVDKGQFDKDIKVSKIEGSCMLLKKEMVQEVSYFDIDFFTYWEDTDLCFRAAKKGFKLFSAPRAKVWHKIASSTGGTVSSHHVYYMTRNRFLFLKKHATKSQLISFLLYFFGYKFWLIAIGSLLIRRDKKFFKIFLKATKDGIKLLASSKGRNRNEKQPE